MSDPIVRATSSVPATAFEPQYISRTPNAADQAGIEVLHDAAFGPGALTRTAYRIREGLPARSPFCRVIEAAGVIVAAARFSPIAIGGRSGALLLGPVAAAAAHANRGLARRAIIEGLDAARSGGIALVLLVGDLSYYGRLGFEPVPLGRIGLPGPVDLTRLLALELRPDALQGYGGMISGDPRA